MKGGLRLVRFSLLPSRLCCRDVCATCPPPLSQAFGVANGQWSTTYK
jgi:hypothetical protein